MIHVTMQRPQIGVAVEQPTIRLSFGAAITVASPGYGSTARLEPVSWDDITASGFYWSDSAATVGIPTPDGGWTVEHSETGAGSAVQIAQRSDVADLRYRHRSAGLWSPWRRCVDFGNLIGPVSQVGGLPTGAVIERGANANGEFTRWADGTQICWRSGLNLSSITAAAGAIFRNSSNATWTFPAPFAAAPAVSGDCDTGDAWGTIGNAPTATLCQFRGYSHVSIATAVALRVMAVGRWFL